MIGRKRFLRVTAVLSVAFATGQTVESLRSSAAVTAADGRSDLHGQLAGPAALSLSGAEDLPGLSGITPVAAAAEAPASDGCSPMLSLAASDGAMIDLVLRAPCDPGQRVVIRHSGLSFTTLMGLDGQLAMSLPALEREALVAAYFEGSAVALATVAVPEVAEQARFGFQAPYPVDFELRAEEGGTIHVGGHSGAGRILTLGTEAVPQPMIAQVYTFPGIDLGSSKLSVEVRITGQTCGNTYLAETRISQGGGCHRADPANRDADLRHFG